MALASNNKINALNTVISAINREENIVRKEKSW